MNTSMVTARITSSRRWTRSDLVSLTEPPCCAAYSTSSTYMTVAGTDMAPSLVHDRRYVFVSHARSDSPLLKSFLADLDVDVWADPDQYDDTHAEKILETAITNSAVFVVLITEVSILRPWVRWE